MSDHLEDDHRVKKERSPSFPFIPLEKAIMRTAVMLQNHRSQPTRVGSLADSWHYAPKSSGLQQTIAALKQYGLIEDFGSGDDRKLQVTDLARRIIQDERPGAREAGRKEAARNPRLISEYLEHWLPVRPSDSHCISELQLDRGFNQESAKLFLRVFDETVSYATLADDDSLSASLGPQMIREETARNTLAALPPVPSLSESALVVGQKPFSQRLKIELTDHSMAVAGMLLNKGEAEKLIKMVQANMVLLPDAEDDSAMYYAGDVVPTTGTYNMSHSGHSGQNSVELAKGTRFPPCSVCSVGGLVYGLRK